MGLFTEKYNTPFDNEQMRRPVDEKFTASHIRPANYLSTRASLLLGYTLVSLCLEFMIAGNAIWWPVACSFACLFVWAITIRFFMPRNLSVISLIFVLALFIAACEYSYRLGFCVPYAVAGFIPMAIGIMSVARFKDDDNDKFTRPAFGREVMLPYAIALVCSVFGTVSTYIFEKRYLFVSLLASVMFLIVMSWTVSKLSGVPRCATSKKLTEFWDIPVANISELRRFLSARGEFAGVCLVCTAAVYVLKIFTDDELFRMTAVQLQELDLRPEILYQRSIDRFGLYINAVPLKSRIPEDLASSGRPGVDHMHGYHNYRSSCGNKTKADLRFEVKIHRRSAFLPYSHIFGCNVGRNLSL